MKNIGIMQLVNTTYSKDDVQILLKDLSGYMQAIDTEERERLIQNGVHYSEMLPLEYKPTDKYIEIYNKSLEEMSETTAKYIAILAEELFTLHGLNLVIISLARAGIPVGILVKRYLKIAYDIDVPHFSISIIRGKGIDVNAMNYIRELCGKSHGIKHFQFLDGWTGKGAITRQLTEAVNSMKRDWAGWDELSDNLAVLADPANLCKTCGTHRDFLIPSACLNSTVSGLVSRTILRKDLIDEEAGEFHGAVYFGDLVNEDRSNEFIDTISSYFNSLEFNSGDQVELEGNSPTELTGMEVVAEIAKHYEISDINLIKPGVGETTRVLLRRVPWKIIINPAFTDKNGIDHIIRLCNEKNVPIEYKDIGNYRACGIIKTMADA